MLSAVLRSDTAIQVSIQIINAFVEMRRFIANNAASFERISSVELKQLEYQKQTDEKFDKFFAYINDPAEPEQKIFFDGQVYDAFELLISLVQKATNKIVLIDGYVDIGTLNILAKKNPGVDVMFGSGEKGHQACSFFIAQGYCSPEDRNNLEYLFRPYKELGGNGTGESLYHKCMDLPLTKEEKEVK